jgi:FlaA1/EpsC-like NDP-sugar epimerase
MPKTQFDLYSATNQKIIDAALAGAAWWLAHLAVLDGAIPPSQALQLWSLLPLVMFGQVLANQALGTYRLVWRYIGLGDAILLARNDAPLPLALAGLRYLLPGSFGFPRPSAGVLLVFYLLFLAGGCAARACRRLQYESAAASPLKGEEKPRVLFLGAGSAGVRAASEVRRKLDFRPLGFLDDDPGKAGTVINGLRVLGPLSALGGVLRQHPVQQVILCIAKPTRELLRRTWATCELFGVAVKMVPSLEQILDGRVSIANFRSVEMKDLLGRDAVESAPTEPAVKAAYSGKRILVTGAGGSIGSELTLQLSKLRPSQLVLLDKDENGLNDCHLQLQGAPGVEVIPVIADLRFPERLRGIFERWRPEIVFHAAAHKHVYLMETNPCEAVANNVSGTRNLVEQCLAFGVARFVQISTDKAVRPTSVMGATKRVCEMIVQSHTVRSSTLFCCVRFGNVLGSRGSVVPIFQKQILRGGPVTVTHPDAQRFLMTVPEAVCLLIQAGTLAHAAQDIFVLDMGEPVFIGKLAEDLIELSGLRPNHDIRIEVTGMKPGEKMSEMLVDNAGEKLRPTGLHKIQTITAQRFDVAEFSQRLQALEKAAWQEDSDEVYRNLIALNIGFVHEVKMRAWPGRQRRSAAAASAGAPIGV